jgi:hypothetical protein
MAEKKIEKMIEITAGEREGLERVALGEPPYSQRAKGLIAMADGANLAEAGMASGLTINQVRYWVGRFGTRRLSIFPEELLVKKTLKKEAEKTPTLLDGPEEAPLLESPEDSPLLEPPELAGELPEIVPDDTAAAVVTAGEAMALKSEKGKNKKSKKSKKNKKSKKDKKSKKSKKDKKSKKSKKGKKGKKGKKVKKGKKSKKSKKDKKKINR